MNKIISKYIENQMKKQKNKKNIKTKKTYMNLKNF